MQLQTRQVYGHNKINLGTWMDKASTKHHINLLCYDNEATHNALQRGTQDEHEVTPYRHKYLGDI